MNKLWLLFVAANLVFIVAIAAVFVVPVANSARNTRSHIAWQQRQYTALTTLNAAHPYLLQEYEALNNQRKLLTYDEVMHALSHISHLTAQHNLRELSFTASEPVAFDSQALERAMHISVRLESEGYYYNVIKFLHEIENTPAIIFHTAIVWENDTRARISLELSLFFQ